mgnify:CR=1 FL=1
MFLKTMLILLLQWEWKFLRNQDHFKNRKDQKNFENDQKLIVDYNKYIE